MPGLVVCYAIAWGLGTLLTMASRGQIAQANAAATSQAAVDGLKQALLAEQRAVSVSAVAAILLVAVIGKIAGFTQR